MKKFSSLKTAVLALAVCFSLVTLSQCTKVEGVVKDLDRSFKGTPDSTVFAAYYNETKVSTADATPDVNDVIKVKGVQAVIKEYCASSNCHGGPIKPELNTYSQIMAYVTPGNPIASKLWEYVTTNDFNKAMPPVASDHELATADKTIIYNWIKNGAKEYPDLADFRPAAIRLIVDGCGSANCHNQGTATGAWARKGLLGALTTADTTQYLYINPATGAVTNYCILSNKDKRNQVWGAYKDSVKKFYQDTLAYASFRPYKIFGTPISFQSTRGPLMNYDDILMDIMYPKSARSNSTVQYTDPVTGVKYYTKGNHLNVASAMVSRVDSTLLVANPYTGIYNATQQGDMAYGDGGLKPSEIALIKAWYFADPNIPDVWKYGQNNVGIFKYRKSGKIITKQ